MEITHNIFKMSDLKIKNVNLRNEINNIKIQCNNLENRKRMQTGRINRIRSEFMKGLFFY
jgi:hypothetical protein